MFSFGLFASHIPYLILAGIYLTYMLVNFSMKQDFFSDADHEEENRTIQVEEASSSGIVHTFILSGNNSDNQNDIASTGFLPGTVEIPITTYSKWKKWLRKDHCIFSPLVYELFSRPPPFA
ncbi:MAG: hypothetical protein K9I94_06205 [Bacteroidales bacterium]|nr:hypothetical protein [Bacteroidales bacterium]